MEGESLTNNKIRHDRLLDTIVILSMAKDLYTSTLCLQILHFVQTSCYGRLIQREYT